MNFDSFFVDAVDNAVKNFVVDGFERNDVEPGLKNDVSGCVLDNSFEIIFVVKVVLPDIDDVPKFLGTLANEKLVDPKRVGIK